MHGVAGGYARGCVGVPADVLVDGGISAHHMSEDVWWLCQRMHRRMSQRLWIVLVDVLVDVLS